MVSIDFFSLFLIILQDIQDPLIKQPYYADEVRKYIRRELMRSRFPNVDDHIIKHFDFTNQLEEQNSPKFKVEMGKLKTNLRQYRHKLGRDFKKITQKSIPLSEDDKAKVFFSLFFFNLFF